MLRAWPAILMALSVSSAVYGQGRLNVEQFKERLDRSERLWQQLVHLHGESYTYVATILRDGGNGREDTEITIEDGTIVERIHAYYDADGLVSKWHEQPGQLGVHSDGSPLLKMEDLYAQCRKEVLSLDPASHWLILDFDQQGLLQRCGSVQATARSIEPVGITLAWVRFAP